MKPRCYLLLGSGVPAWDNSCVERYKGRIIYETRPYSISKCIFLEGIYGGEFKLLDNQGKNHSSKAIYFGHWMKLVRLPEIPEEVHLVSDPKNL